MSEKGKREYECLECGEKHAAGSWVESLHDRSDDGYVAVPCPDYKTAQSVLGELRELLSGLDPGKLGELVEAAYAAIDGQFYDCPEGDRLRTALAALKGE